MRKALFGALLLAGVPSVAQADDGAASLATGSIVFTKVVPVRMKFEDLYISPEKVRVRFEFENDTDRDFETVVAFPLPDVDMRDFWAQDSGPVTKDLLNFVGFSARVDGKPTALQAEQRAISLNTKRDVTALVKGAGLSVNILSEAGHAKFEKMLNELPPAKLKKLEAAGVLDDGPNWIMRTRFYWTQRFPAHQTVVIEHSYAPINGNYNSAHYFADAVGGKEFCVDKPTGDAITALVAVHDKKGDSSNSVYVDYILKTAKTWRGAIGRFHVTFDKLEPWYVMSVCWPGALKKTGPTTFEYTTEQFTPDRDIHMLVAQ